MATTKFTAKLANYSGEWESNRIKQGNWGYGTRLGVMYFAGLSNLSEKIIDNVSISVTSASAGYKLSKSAYFYESSVQGGIDLTNDYGHKTGSSFQTITGVLYNKTLSFQMNSLKSRINDGQDTFCVYDTTKQNYLLWTNVVLTVEWTEPKSTIDNLQASVVLGEELSFDIDYAGEQYTHTASLSYGTWSEDFVISDYTATITPSYNFAYQFTTSVSAVASVLLTTKNGDVVTGTDKKTITLNIPNDIQPSVGTLSIVPYTSPSGFENIVLQGQSTVKATLSGYSGSYGSTISNIHISGSGYSSDTDTLISDNIRVEPEVEFKAFVTDSRGWIVSTSASISVQKYSYPKIISSKLYRCTVDGDEYNNGEYLYAYVNCSIQEMQGNTMNIKLQYKESTSDTWITASSNFPNDSVQIISGFSNLLSYNIRFVLSDSIVDEITYTSSIGMKVVTMSRLVKDGIPSFKFGGVVQPEDEGYVSTTIPFKMADGVIMNGNLGDSYIAIDDVKQFALSCELNSLTQFKTYGDITSSVPWADFESHSGEVLRQDDGDIIVRMYNQYTAEVAIMGYSNETWTDWRISAESPTFDIPDNNFESGYFSFPNGLTFIWGTTGTASNGVGVLNYPVTLTKVFVATATVNYAGGGGVGITGAISSGYDVCRVYFRNSSGAQSNSATASCFIVGKI